MAEIITEEILGGLERVIPPVRLAHLAIGTIVVSIGGGLLGYLCY
jgi:hypothetical protein